MSKRGFNPRPPRKVGALVSNLERWALRHTDYPQRVSILAHLERWALRCGSHRGRQWKFQSSPTSKGGRYHMCRPRPPALNCFNPRPPRKVGATNPPTSFARSQTGCFNPRPPRKVGATLCKHEDTPTCPSFNPRPPRKVGATVLRGAWEPRGRVSILAHLERWALLSKRDVPRPLHVVSILAHLERWALRRFLNVCRQWHPCFNPRPPRKVGATGGMHGLGQSPESVSILAHLERWALRVVSTSHCRV